MCRSIHEVVHLIAELAALGHSQLELQKVAHNAATEQFSADSLLSMADAIAVRVFEIDNPSIEPAFAGRILRAA